MLDFFLNKIFHPYYIYPVPYSAWGIRLNALVNVQLVMSAKHLVSTRCQQCARWPHLCPSSWLSSYMLTGKLKFQTSHNICSGNSYSSMLQSITFYNLPNIVCTWYVCFILQMLRTWKNYGGISSKSSLQENYFLLLSSWEPRSNKHNECFHHADKLTDAFQIFSYHHLYSHFKYLASFP